MHDLFEEFCTCFNEADHVIVADIYAAGEAAIPGISRDDLVTFSLNAHGHRSVSALNAPEDLPDQIMAMAKPGDLVICLGAGTITQWANRLPSQFQARLEEQDGIKAKKGKRMIDQTTPISLEDLPPVRGQLRKRKVAFAKITWFQVGGPADIIFNQRIWKICKPF